MNRVLQLEKRLSSAPEPAPIAGFELRSFREQEDLPAWLALRQATFAREKLGVRDWDLSDFRQEFVNKSWWKPEHCWVLEESGLLATSQDPVGSDAPTRLIGSVTLAMRTTATTSQPVVHWLMVHPRYRHAGLAQWLLATLEAKAWQLGYRTVCLETHSSWESAARFYQSAGYVQSEPSSGS